jgi:NAD(P)-dependent dehydrogenase (short-subunit alcohol dehydrogenase family)
VLRDPDPGGHPAHRTTKFEENAVSRILITGSSDGLGLQAARLLIAAGDDVVLHARNAARAEDTAAAAPGAAGVLVGDLSSIEQTTALAADANASGPLDAVIHNAAVGYREPRRIETVDGLAHVFAVNALAPYLLTALVTPPRRLVYLSSGMATGGDPALDDLQWTRRRWDGAQAYSDSKLFDAVLAFAVARRWPGVLSNAVEPGWVPTRIGGPGAPDDLVQAPVTQAWLAASKDPEARVSGRYFYHLRRRATHPAARDETVQEGFLAACAELTGVKLGSGPTVAERPI